MTLADLRIAIRTLRRAPGFSATVILILALGIGTTSAVFTVVNAVLLHGLPFREPERLVFIRGLMQRETTDEWPLGYQDLRDLNAPGIGLTNISAVTGARSFNVGIAGGGEPEHVTGEMVSAEYFAALGVSPVLGRFFSPEEATPPARAAVVLSDEFWSARYGRDRTVIGRTITLNERPYEIIGIAAPGLRGLSDGARVWLPIGLAGSLYGAHYLELRMFRWLSGVARLAPGVSLETAQRLADTAAARMTALFPTENRGLSFELTPLPDVYFGDLRGPLTALLAASAFVMLIACANVSSLLLVRGTARRRESSLRIALGSGRSGIISQLLAEGVVLSLAGCVVGLLLAAFAVRSATATADLFPSFTRVTLDWRVALAGIAASAVCVLVFALAPAFFAMRVSPLEALKEGGGTTGGRGSHRIRQGLVAAEVALAVILLVGAARMIGEFGRLIRTDLGFEPESVVTARIDLSGPSFAANERVAALALDLTDRLRALPGVRGAALEGPGLPVGPWYASHFRRPGSDSDEDAILARRHHVTPGYFATLGVPLRGGRDFTTADAIGTERVAIISQRLARMAFGGADPLGRQLSTLGQQPVALTIVGIVGDVRQEGLSSDHEGDPNIYIPMLQSPPRSPPLISIMLQTSGEPGGLERQLQIVASAVSPGLPVYDVQPLVALLDEQTARSRLLLGLMIGFGIIALVLASVGVYGVTAAAVHETTRDIGIRRALGAQPSEVALLVLRRGMTPVVLGLVAGIVAVVPLGRLAEAVLAGVGSGENSLVVALVAALVVASVIATGLPAWRAVRVTPSSVLRNE